jgi:hypothetical protein
MKDKLKNLGAWALARAQERSTYVGVALVIGAFAGHQLDDSTVNAIAFVGQFIGAGLVAASTKHP